MEDDKYIRMRRWFAERPRTDRVLHIISDMFTAAVYAVYIATSVVLFVKKSRKLREYILVPGAVFAAGSIFRAVIDAPRPYDELDIELNGKKKRRLRAGYRSGGAGPESTGERKKRGKSFPSRHAFSAAVIAVASAWLDPAAGIAMTAVALGVAATRVLTGVHWIRDVVCGLLYGAAGGIAGFGLLDRLSRR